MRLQSFCMKNYISVLVHVIVFAILFARKHKTFCQQKKSFQEHFPIETDGEKNHQNHETSKQILIKTILKAVSMAFYIFINTSNAVTSLKVKAHFQIQVLLEYILK